MVQQYKSKKYGDTYRIVYELAALETEWKVLFIKSWNEICSKSEQEYFKLEFVKNLIQTLLIFTNKSATELLPLQEISHTGNKKNSSSGYQFVVNQYKYEDDKSYHVLDIFLHNITRSRRSLSSASKYTVLSKAQQKQKVIQLYFDTRTKKGKLIIFVRPSYQIPLFIKENEKNQEIKLYIYERYTKSSLRRNRIPFLNHILKQSAKNKISSLGGSREFHIDKPEQRVSNVNISRDIFGAGANEFNKQLQISEIENNPKNFRYYLNLRGFLLFLIEVQSHSRYKVKINKVIKGLTENEYTKCGHDFDFLSYYEIFDEIYGSDFKIDILKRIATELENQLKGTDGDYLRYWITRRFHSAMIYSRASHAFPYPLYHPMQVTLWNDKITENQDRSLMFIINSLKEYDRMMLRYLLQYQQNEIEETRNFLKNIPR